jgi:PAS domain S-box-containing protein
MRGRSGASGEPAKAQRRKAGARKRRVTAKAVHPRDSLAAREETKVARLTRERNEALRERRAAADVLKIISRSSLHLEQVLDILVETVARLCRADHALMFRRREDVYRLFAARGLSHEAKEFFLANPFAPGRGTLAGRVALERRVIHLTDVLRDPEYTHNAPKISGARTSLGIPLLRDEALIGIFVAARTRVHPFTTKEIELATSFADQAVIAIENARLFDELRERQTELRVTFDNMGDGVVMFNADARLAAWNRNFQEMLELPDEFLTQRPTYAEYFRYLAERGEYSTDVEAELGQYIEDVGREMRLERSRPDGRIIEVRRNPVPGGGFVTIFSDVTERRKVEKALRESESRANALSEQAAEQARSTERTLELLVRITGIASSAPNVPTLASACLEEICDSCQWQFGQVWYPDAKREALVCSDESVAGTGDFVQLREVSLKTPMPRGQGIPGRIWETGSALWLTDPTGEIVELGADDSRLLVKQDAGNVFFPRNLARREFGLGAVMGFPVKLDKEVLAVFEFFSRERRPPDASFLDTVEKLGRLLGDVLERKRAEEALRSSEERWRSVFDTSTFGISLIGGDLRYLTANTTFRNQMGYTVDELRQLGPPDLSMEADRELSRTSLIELLAGDRAPFDVVKQYRRKDGTVIWGHSYVCRVAGSRSTPPFILGSTIDVTEGKRDQDALRAMQTEVARVARLTTVGEMATAIAHELKQPLAAITVNSNAALRWLSRPTPDLDEVRTTLSQIVSDGRRAGDVVGSIRAMFKQDGKERTLVDLKELIPEVVTLVHGETDRHRIRVSTHLDDELPKVLAHRVQLQQVVLNLVVNAIEAMGSVDSREHMLRITAQVRGPTDLVIAVEDSGCGIEPKDMDRIFDRFFTTKSHGIGMGLWICRSIVEAHEGRLWAEPGIQHGSVFRLQLPIPTPPGT